jgi:hypothetical protein
MSAAMGYNVDQSQQIRYSRGRPGTSAGYEGSGGQFTGLRKRKEKKNMKLILMAFC